MYIKAAVLPLAAPTPMRLPPGPDKDRTSTTVNTSLVAGFMWVTISGAVIAAIAFAVILHRTRQPGQLFYQHACLHSDGCKHNYRVSNNFETPTCSV